MAYHWDFQPIWSYREAFFASTIVTLELSLLASIVGTLIGFLIAVLWRHCEWFSANCIQLILDLLRAVPSLVLIFLFYYFPYSEVLGIPGPSAFSATFFALTVAQAAYSADLVRWAWQRVPHEHTLGLEAIGFTPLDVSRHAVFPWLLRETLPGHLALYIGNVKLSSLSSSIGVHDVVYVAKIAAAQSFRSLEAWLIVASIYSALILPLSWAHTRLKNSMWQKCN